MRRLLCLFAVFVAGCSLFGDSDDDNGAAPDAEELSVSGTTIPQSVGLVRVGPSAYDLVFSCVDGGAGEILAAGVGRDVNNKPVHAFVQAYVGEPYIGLEVGEEGEEVLFEPRLGVLLDFTFEHDIIRFDNVDFVTELNIETGEYTPAGIGSVVVECRSYETEIPDEILE
ncbi:MAG: hypothetical protein F4Y27_00600 [Acidimicrobiaceae bacterium]|nr:hypothetical protein [Acidimicrobiaceae bacterium]MXW62956.1 hypothetical protein [Acidimicrobiaceae bacterium]MXW76220.1 hypothetical protein [Acidimicrobiaceae bacterium]MYA73170.1 hypothetical protein [Acidimicrobiaceae bacterium]MYD07119.1 hypothetical protein [Acidimicrobiaceae bacterium]